MHSLNGIFTQLGLIMYKLHHFLYKWLFGLHTLLAITLIQENLGVTCHSVFEVNQWFVSCRVASVYLLVKFYANSNQSLTHPHLTPEDGFLQVMNCRGLPWPYQVFL